MRPEQLKCPFSWEQRGVMIADRVWYVPPACSDQSFVFPGWDHVDLFGCERPLAIEYCSGNGAWIAEKAKAHPEFNWIAVERKFDRVRKIWSKVKNLQLPNLITVCGEGLNFTQKYLHDQSVSQIYINFPDPWPKLRHAKHRLLQPLFVRELHRILKPQGGLTVVTDDINYSQEIIPLLANQKGFASQHPGSPYINELAGYGTSYFEDLWREQGLEIRYHCVMRKD